ncbi:MAG: hypothetical protein M1828_004532 [Chrysothrix sp. TS-e1954]|nr:MAG: hypothetical protein M1828_004532 [Chrysothrix sp. TS-e1954]
MPTALSLSLKGVTLPAKCLKRSASDETIEWLKDLICDGAGIDEDVWRSTFLGEDVEYMWGEAVRRRDSELLVALMSDAVGMKPLTKHLRWAVEESSCDLSLIRTLMEFHRCRGETTEWPLSDPILAAMLSENVPTEEIQQGLQNVPRRVILLHTKDIHTVYRANLTTKKPCFCIRETMPNGQRTARWRVMTEELRMRLARKRKYVEPKESTLAALHVGFCDDQPSPSRSPSYHRRRASLLAQCYIIPDPHTSVDMGGEAEVRASTWRNVELGRIVYFTKGPYHGRLAAIVEIIDHKRVLIDGPSVDKTQTVPRQAAAISDLALLPLVIPKLPRAIGTGPLRKAWEKAEIDDKWKNSNWSKQRERTQKKKENTDFGRFKAMILKKQQRDAVRVELAKVRASAKS